MKLKPFLNNHLYLLFAALWLVMPAGNCIAEVIKHIDSLADGRSGKFSYQTLNRKTTIPDLQAGRIS